MKKIWVILLCLSIFIFGIFKLFNKEKVVLDNVILDMNNSKDGLAIYIEKYDAEGNASYVESDSNTFPLDNYVYNRELSGCLDSNSNEVEGALNYNYVDKELNLRVNKPVTCYVYYDYKGEGTETIPYKIRSIEDLLDLSQSVNLGETYAGNYFELTRDLDFSDSNSYNDSERIDYGNLNGIADDGDTLMKELTSGTGWIPIGTLTNRFKGIFNGNNKVIKNIYINNNIAEISVGLFGSVMNSTIKDLTLDGNIKTIKLANMGSFIGNAYHNTTVDNCVNKVTVISETGNWSSGGLVGATYDTVTIKNSHNEGNVTGGAWIGGIVGGFSNGTLTIEDSYNTGTISKIDDVTIRGIGGLVGSTNSADSSSSINITNSYNTGEISDTSQAGRNSYVGGLIGTSTVKVNINGSYNNGKVIINGSDRLTYSGGLIGYAIGNAYINESYNIGSIETNIASSLSTVVLGGIIGFDTGKTIMTNSHNIANLTGGNRLGGLIGMGQGSNAKIIIDKSYNTGSLSPWKDSNWGASVYVGGITSFAWEGTEVYLFNSYNSGDMESNSLFRNGYAGFVTGINGSNVDSQKVNILNSYNIGNISNSFLGAGFYLLTKGTLKLNNVYSNVNFWNNVTTKYGIGTIVDGQTYDVKKAYYRNKAEDGSDIAGSNIENNEIIGKELSYMQSEAFVTELNNNISSINLSEYIDNTLLEEFKATTGYELKLSEWKLKDGHPVLVALEGM